MQAVATWWGYAEGDRTLVAVVVALIAVAAVGFVAKRVWEQRKAGANG